MGLSFRKLKIAHRSSKHFVQNRLSGNELNDTATDKQTNNVQLFLHHITKKSELLSNAGDFALIDHHAKNAPAEIISNVDQLLNYLMSSCGSSVSTVRTVYVWIITHIMCSDRSPRCTDLDKSEPLIVLSKKQGSLCDINTLFHYLCQALSVPSVLIHGVVKSPEEDLQKLTTAVEAVNHVWSLVLVQNQWRFVDCACGGGYLDTEDVDKGDALEMFFLPDPEDFILTHYPVHMANQKFLRTNSYGNIAMTHYPVHMPNQKFLKTTNYGNIAPSYQAEETLQMLDYPVSFPDFCKLPSPTVFAVCNSVHLVTHSSAHITIKLNETFEFSAPYFVNMSAVLSECPSGDVINNTVLATRFGNSRYRVFVKPKCVGEYRLTVFGANEDSQRTNFRTVVVYHLHVEEVEKHFSPMPDLFGVWGANQTAPQYGFTDKIFRFDALTSRSGEIYIKLPTNRFVLTKSVLKFECCGAAADALFPSSHSTLNQFSGGVVQVRARFPQKGFYSLSLQARSRDDDGTEGADYVTVANFFINCLTPSAIFSGYPRSLPVSQTCQTLLLEPLRGDLVVDKAVVFRLRSSMLTSALVDGEEMVRETTDDCFGGHTWRLEYTPTRLGVSVCIYGMVSLDASLHALYKFCTVGDNILTVSTHM